MEHQVSEQPLVTIIAICHNHALYVTETLDSIRNQTYPNIQCIIINNLENDGSKEVIETWIEKYQYPARFIQNQNPLSITKNLNIGLQYAEGTYFQCIACDDILMPMKIEWQVEVFENASDKVACVYGDALYIDEGSIVTTDETLQEKKQARWGLEKFAEGSLSTEISRLAYIPAPTVLLRTSSVIQIGGYDESFIFEDWPLWVTLTQNGFLFIPVKSPVVKYRILSTSLGNDHANIAYLNSLLAFYKKNIDFIDFRYEKTFGNFCSVAMNANKNISNFILFFRIFFRFRRIKEVDYFIKYLLS